MQGFLTMPYQHDELRFNDYLYLFADRSTSFHFRFAGEQRKGRITRRTIVAMWRTFSSESKRPASDCE